jgi:hypothetical protein
MQVQKGERRMRYFGGACSRVMRSKAREMSCGGEGRKWRS